MGLKGVSVGGTVHKFDYEYLENKPTIPGIRKLAVTLNTNNWGLWSTGNADVVLPDEFLSNDSLVDDCGKLVAFESSSLYGVTSIFVNHVNAMANFPVTSSSKILILPDPVSTAAFSGAGETISNLSALANDDGSIDFVYVGESPEQPLYLVILVFDF